MNSYTTHIAPQPGRKDTMERPVNDTTVAARRENERKLWVKKTLFRCTNVY